MFCYWDAIVRTFTHFANDYTLLVLYLVACVSSEPTHDFNGIDSQKIGFNRTASNNNSIYSRLVDSNASKKVKSDNDMITVQANTDSGSNTKIIDLADLFCYFVGT